MKLSQIREKYIEYFKGKQHHFLPSFPLVPAADDKSLLLVNSGMAPMKKFFTGEVTPPSPRVVTCQKCIRTLDIDIVGTTSRHGTFFEMLGNFSFGDYFKTEAISYAWDFMLNVLKFDENLLWVSVYEEDFEAKDIWLKTGINPEKIVFLGKADNFWEHGAGPCGPCSEIYVDRGQAHGCEENNCQPGCECDRFVEVWNLVFTQFESDGKGNYTPLANPNIDTGMGLDRLACIMQNVDSIFEVDTMKSVLDVIAKSANVEYGKSTETDTSLRIITDHVRSACFLIADGVTASNEGRGYILRRLIRRALAKGQTLGTHETFLKDAANEVIAQFSNAYPELKTNQNLILKLINAEQESFAKTLADGMKILENIADDIKFLSGDEAFKLYDTYGFPLELTQDILLPRGIEVDEAGFEKLMQNQREQARKARKVDGEGWYNDDNLFADLPATKFTGYDDFSGESKILKIVSEGQERSTIKANQKAIIALDKTPFYAESGGQAADIGFIKSSRGIFRIDNVKADDKGVCLHFGECISGEISVGDATAEIDIENRLATCRNHTATHLLQAALRKILGDHVTQAGSSVNADLLRFDFTHFAALTADEIAKIENEINHNILQNLGIKTQEMSANEAKNSGAMALFGEKYGDVVRVVKIGENLSVELCGGTHVKATGEIGLFKILSESSIASGVRRIEAATGFGVINLLENFKQNLLESAAHFKTNNFEDLPAKISQNITEIKTLRIENDKLKSQIASAGAKNLLDDIKEIGEIKLLAKPVQISAADGRTIVDDLKAENENLVIILACTADEKPAFVAGVGKKVQDLGVHAGKLVSQIAAVTGGKGGGRPDFASAGIGDARKIDEALNLASEILQ